MIRHAAVLALLMCGWAAGCGVPPVPDPAGADASRPEKPTDTGSVVAWHLPVPALEYNTREGRTTFLHYCAPCHGEHGHGDGFNAYNLDPKPRDLADPVLQEARTDEDLAAVVRTGGGVAGLSSSMPPWGRTLNERQIHNLVRYMRYLPELIDPDDLAVFENRRSVVATPKATRRRRRKDPRITEYF